MPGNDEQNHGKLLSESVSILTLFRVIFIRNRVCARSVRLHIVRFSFRLPDPRSARACAVETQFLNFKVAV